MEKDIETLTLKALTNAMESLGTPCANASLLLHDKFNAFDQMPPEGHWALRVLCATQGCCLPSHTYCLVHYRHGVGQLYHSLSLLT